MLRFIVKAENEGAKAIGSFYLVLTNSSLETQCLKPPFIQCVYSVIYCCNAVETECKVVVSLVTQCLFRPKSRL